jgi:hypothetical protein
MKALGTLALVLAFAVLAVCVPRLLETGSGTSPAPAVESSRTDTDVAVRNVTGDTMESSGLRSPVPAEPELAEPQQNDEATEGSPDTAVAEAIQDNISELSVEDLYFYKTVLNRQFMRAIEGKFEQHWASGHYEVIESLNMRNAFDAEGNARPNQIKFEGGEMRAVFLTEQQAPEAWALFQELKAVRDRIRGAQNHAAIEAFGALGVTK